MRNSRKDPKMVEAVRVLRSLMREVAYRAEDAQEEYLQNPRWCGIADVDLPNGLRRLVDIPCYPVAWGGIAGMQWLQQDELKKMGIDVLEITSQEQAHKVHTLAMARFVKVAMFESVPAGSFAAKHCPTDANRDVSKVDGVEEFDTPRKTLDRMRRMFRYEERLDVLNELTMTFALLQVKKIGKPRPSDQWHESRGPSPVYHRWEYLPLKRSELEGLPAVLALSDAIRRVFDHCSVSLIPSVITREERRFLDWLVNDKGGSCRLFEASKWFEQNPDCGRQADGQGAESRFIRKFCDKTGPRGTRKAWQVRREAAELLNT